jgi:hypothetical protein
MECKIIVLMLPYEETIKSWENEPEGRKWNGHER